MNTEVYNDLINVDEENIEIEEVAGDNFFATMMIIKKNIYAQSCNNLSME